MRITNKIMQNNQMYNINQNKIKEDKYARQMSTKKKINRASEDPVVAIRALRLRSNVTELTQYYEKNSKDAESWLKVTEDALTNVTDLLTSAIGQANKGANKLLTSTDLSAIITEMTQLTEEYYSTGNVDYGGRYVFTGYRTDTPLTFMEKTSLDYSDIKDLFNASDVEDVMHISGTSTIDPNADKNGGGPTIESDVTTQTVGRIRLSYKSLDELATSDYALKYRENFDVPATSSIYQPDDGTGMEVTVNATIDGTPTTIKVKLPDKVTEEGEETSPQATAAGFTLSWNSDGTYKLTKKSGDIINLSTNGAVYSSYRETTVTNWGTQIKSTTSAADKDAVYKEIETTNKNDPTEKKAWFDSATGEILLSDGLKKALGALPDIVNADTIEVTYDKGQWEKGDIRPENLFECTTVSPYDSSKTIHYNGGTYGHVMKYDVGYSQTIDVNTQANEMFTTDVKRCMDDLNEGLKKYQVLETTIDQIKTNIETGTGNRADLEKELAAAEKARDFLRDDLQKQLESKITDFQKALDVANTAVTENGTRSRRLELIQNRLMNQVTTIKTLASENEDIDMAETATNLMTAQTIYNASLQATGKISQQSLMDYI